MSAVWTVWKAETFRLARGRAAWVAGAFLVLLSWLRVVAAHLAERSAYVAAVTRAARDGRPTPPLPEPSNAYGPFVDGWSAGLTVGALLLLIVAARALAGDLESGLLRLARTRSASRSALVWGRALLGLPLCLGVVLASAFGAWVGAAWLFDFGPVVEDGYELASEALLRHQLLLACATTFPALLATWSLGLLVSCLSPGGATAVGVGLLVYLGFDLFKEVLGETQYWVFAAFNPSFVDHSYVREVAGMARGFSDAGFSEALLRQNLILPWPEALALVALAGWVLSRRAL